VLRNLLEKPIPKLREVSPGYPQALEDVVARALNRDRDARFDTAAEFAEELEKASEGLGVASSKQVAAYVKDVAGELIDAMMRRVRAFQEGAKVTPASVLANKLELAENADSSVRSTTSAPVIAKDILGAQEVTRSRRPLVMGAAAMVLVLVGAIVATITLLVASQGAKTDRPTAVTPPPKATTAAQVTTTAAPVDSSPTISVMDLPRANDTHARPQLPRRPTPPTSATVTAPTTATATTTKPAPTSTAFNPESM
jgi:serine/threonine-protein kinase